MSDSMFSILVAINIKPEQRNAFIEASTTEAQGSVKGEPELFQFQMLVDDTNPNRFYFFEIFKNEDAFNFHLKTEVFKTWWNTVEEMFDGEPERTCTMRTIFPSVSGLKKQKPGLMHW